MTSSLPTPVRSPEKWLAETQQARRAGDNLRAFDLASQALAQHPGTMTLEYEAVLALTRAGATNQAEARLKAIDESGQIRGVTDHALAKDFAALKGRLLKDRCFEATGAVRSDLARSSALAYEDAFRRTGEFFPAINAATMWCFAGEHERMTVMARTALRLAEAKGNDYWAVASASEALVLLDDVEGAALRLRAATLGEARLDDIASTRRQIRRLSEIKGLGSELVEALGEPDILCFDNRPPEMISELGPPDEARTRIAALLASSLDRATASIAFVSLLDAVDICMAQALLERGAELNLVIPCGLDVLNAAVIAKAGPHWEQPLRESLAHARTVRSVTNDGRPDEETLIALCTRQMIGMALLRGEALDAPVHRLSLRQERPARGDPVELAIGPLDARPMARGSDRRADPAPPARVERALVFGDVRGFSKLKEDQLPVFLDQVMGGFGDALARFGDAVEHVETAGDGIYLVMRDVGAAARCCLALQETMQPQRIAALGLPPHLGLRIGAHVGPVSRGFDRLVRQDKFFGTEIIRTARIEPVTPVGEIYVTEQLAATLYCETGGEFRCEYVGIQPMAKGYGECRMYSLRRIQTG